MSSRAGTRRQPVEDEPDSSEEEQMSGDDEEMEGAEEAKGPVKAGSGAGSKKGGRGAPGRGGSGRGVRPSEKTSKKAKGKVGRGDDPLDKRRRKKRSMRKMDSFLYRLMKSVDPSFRISRKGMKVVNSFVSDILERMAMEAGTLVKKSAKSTLRVGEAHSAALLVLPGELSKMGISEGQRAVQTYSRNMGLGPFRGTKSRPNEQ